MKQTKSEQARFLSGSDAGDDIVFEVVPCAYEFERWIELFCQ
jgi:hypothetical protein